MIAAAIMFLAMPAFVVLTMCLYWNDREKITLINKEDK